MIASNGLSYLKIVGICIVIVSALRRSMYIGALPTPKDMCVRPYWLLLNAGVLFIMCPKKLLLSSETLSSPPPYLYIYKLIVAMSSFPSLCLWAFRDSWLLAPDCWPLSWFLSSNSSIILLYLLMNFFICSFYSFSTSASLTTVSLASLADSNCSRVRSLAIFKSLSNKNLYRPWMSWPALRFVRGSRPLPASL